MEYFPAEPRAPRFLSDLAELQVCLCEIAQKAEKTMMLTSRKCYIVLRTVAFLRKDSL